jgi:multisubunit Na+/H+ antiporter MnhE subunit
MASDRYRPRGASRGARFACHAGGQAAGVTGPDVTEQDSADRAEAVPTGPLAGEPRERALDLPWVRRVGAWLIWWILMMAFWVMLDDSIATDELLAGAGAAALAALLAELVTYQAASRFRMRISWLVPALRLPGEVARDTVIVYAALWRRLAHGQQPDSAFAELPARFGDDTPEGVTRRTLLIGGRSLAPNTFVLGIDPERDVMVVHQLVAGRQGKGK